MSHLKALAVVAGLVILLGLGWMGWQQRSSSSAVGSSGIPTVKEMEQNGIPLIAGTDIFGQKFSSEDMKGQIVIINFWASWCGPCVQEVPSLIKLTNEFKGKIRVIAISEDTNEEDIRIFLKSFPDFKNAQTNIFFDQKHDFMKIFDVKALPESFIAGKDLKLVKKISGTIDWYTPDAKEYIKGLLAAP